MTRIARCPMSSVPGVPHPAVLLPHTLPRLRRRGFLRGSWGAPPLCELSRIGARSKSRDGCMLAPDCVPECHRAHIDLDQAGSGIGCPVAGGEAAAPLASRLVPCRLQKDLNAAALLPAPGLGSFSPAQGAKGRSLHSGQATTASAMFPRARNWTAGAPQGGGLNSGFLVAGTGFEPAAFRL